ncbi:MAG: hypothetical protein G01um10148_140 [Parcubacteria group bacterium Gr01-1014_8]|nr:MAG: hypothetical protein G01um10148_140 [Parcubacteria group bacterium Gr01-1014_8]
MRVKTASSGRVLSAHVWGFVLVATISVVLGAALIRNTVQAAPATTDPGAKCGDPKFTIPDPPSMELVNDEHYSKAKWKECIKKSCEKKIEGNSGCFDKDSAKCKEYCNNKLTTKGKITGQCCSEVVEKGGKDICTDGPCQPPPGKKAGGEKPPTGGGKPPPGGGEKKPGGGEEKPPGGLPEIPKGGGEKKETPPQTTPQDPCAVGGVDWSTSKCRNTALDKLTDLAGDASSAVTESAKKLGMMIIGPVQHLLTGDGQNTAEPATYNDVPFAGVTGFGNTGTSGTDESFLQSVAASLSQLYGALNDLFTWF